MQQIETGTWFEKCQAARAAEAARTASCVKEVLLNHSTIWLSWLKDNTLLQTNGDERDPVRHLGLMVGGVIRRATAVGALPNFGYERLLSEAVCPVYRHIWVSAHTQRIRLFFSFGLQ
jgi:hypothetical protein